MVSASFQMWVSLDSQMLFPCRHVTKLWAWKSSTSSVSQTSQCWKVVEVHFSHRGPVPWGRHGHTAMVYYQFIRHSHVTDSHFNQFCLPVPGHEILSVFTLDGFCVFNKKLLVEPVWVQVQVGHPPFQAKFWSLPIHSVMCVFSSLLVVLSTYWLFLSWSIFVFLLGSIRHRTSSVVSRAKWGRTAGSRVSTQLEENSR